MIFLEETDSADWKGQVPWEGGLPGDFDKENCAGLFDNGFVPVECAKGDLVVFPGTLDHLSLANRSAKSRHTFQLHLVEGTDDVTWSASNWLQYPEREKFVALST